MNAISHWCFFAVVFPYLPAAGQAPGPAETGWSLRPIPLKTEVSGNAVDFFVQEKLKEKGLTQAPQADSRTLIRRLYFDLIGLPPSFEEVEAYVQTSADSSTAYSSLIDQLLASPRYGERWARHWLDVVHYGDTHGYDKDQPRPNAWPYRDYVIRAFNEDKPYARFVEEQLAGDVLFPHTRDGIEALGFIAAGPWDMIGHAEVPEEKTDGKIARHLDRDDMVATTLSNFTSLTVHCAQCHDHKFDPISMEDYYSLQAVFSAVDRAERAYDVDPAIAKERHDLTAQQATATAHVAAIVEEANATGGSALAALQQRITAAKQPPTDQHAQYGWHSTISLEQHTEKWVQVDLGKKMAIQQVVLRPCNDDFNGIGAGFGFPIRYKIEASDDSLFARSTMLADETKADVSNPKLAAVSIKTIGSHRYLRVTATKLAPRKDDFIFSLAELQALDPTGLNVADGATVTAQDSIEAPPRWQRTNLTDGWFMSENAENVRELERAQRELREAALGAERTEAWKTEERRLANINERLAKLPPPARVYCGTVYAGTGSFKGTGGKPRPIHLLARGDVNKPGGLAQPGALSAVTALPSRFLLANDMPEGQRRAALAKWITDPRNPLTWRSIVNRIWQYHFGRGLVDTPNDFGKMGSQPSHPALLEWLAAEFRDSGGSIKALHRLILTSKTYQAQSEAHHGSTIDPENRLLWKMNRRKLDAEAVRDSILAVSGLLELKMGGPAFQDFVMEHPEHSPHYQYHLADLSRPEFHRRSIYRFLVRSKPQPWMATLDCADPSMLVDRRTQTITPLQALAQLNNQLVLVAAQKFAKRVSYKTSDKAAQLQYAVRLALSRDPSPQELRALADKDLVQVCRVLLNLNEFVFID